MPIASFICLVILLLVIVSCFRKDADILSPSRVFIFIWALAIGLADLKLSGFQHIWSVYSWIILMVGLLSFLLGNYIGYVINANSSCFSHTSIRTIYNAKKKFRLDGLFRVIALLFILYLFSFIIETLAFGTLPILSKQPDFARVHFGIFGIHLFVNSMPSILFLCAEYLVLNSDLPKKKLIVWSIFCATMLTYSFLLERYNYFFSAIMIFVFLYYASKVVTVKKVIISSILFAIFTWLLQSIRLSQYASQFIYITSKMRYSIKYAEFTAPYMYISMNLENLAYSITKLTNHSYGILTGDWVLALTGMKQWVTEYFNVDYRRFVYSGYNTFPFIWDYYYDFGIIGTFILPLITGLFVSFIYYYMKIKPHVWLIAIYSFFVFTIVISFFTNPLTSLNIIFNLCIIWVVNRFYISAETVVDRLGNKS